MKRVYLTKNRARAWAGAALICLLSPALAQESSETADGAVDSEPAATAEAPQDESQLVVDDELTEADSIKQSAADVLSQAPAMEVEQLEEMVQVFQRLGNQEMVDALSEVLLAKDPDNAIGAGTAIEDNQANIDEADEDTPSAADLAADHAEKAVAAGRHDAAVEILRRLKASEFRGRSFPYQQDLAYALLESGQLDAASDTFRELANDWEQTSADRADAEARLVDVQVQIESKRAMQLLAEDKGAEAIALADGLLRLHPANESALALKAEVLTKSAHYTEAAEFLKALKSRAGTGAFVFQQSLAYAVYESEGRAEAEPYFVELTGAGYPADQRLDAMERLRDFKIERLYERGMKAILTGDPAAALRIGNRLMQANPSPNEAYELTALALKAQRRFTKAVELLEQYRRARFAGKPFPMQSDLADCHAGAGDFLKAKRAYKDIIDAPSANEAADIRDAVQGLAELAPITDPFLSIYSEYFTEQEGDMFRADVEGRTGILGMHQFAIRAHFDDINIADSFIKNGRYDRWDVSATYTATLSNRFYADVTGGGSADEFLYGAGIGRHAMGGLGWKVYVAGNERATDSLTLEALDGRQDAVHFDVNASFGKGWILDGRFNVRQVKVDGNDIGDGFQADVQFGKTLRQASPISSGVYVGYIGEFSTFNYSTPVSSELRTLARSNNPVILPALDIAGTLVSEEINRHGIEIILERQITPRIAAAIVGGLGWAFEEDQFLYRGGVNVSYRIRDNVYIQAGIDYDSSGTAGNTESGVVFASIMLRIFF